MSGTSERELRQFVLSPACTLKPASCRLVALALASLADWGTGRGQASQAAIAAACGLSDRQVREQLLKLRALNGTEGAPRYEIWTRNSTDGVRLPNGYIITVPNRKPAASAQAVDLQGTGSGPPGSLSNPLSGAVVGYTERTLRPVEEVDGTTSNPGRTRGLTASRPGKWEKIGVELFQPTVKHVQFAREAGLSSVEQLARFQGWHAVSDKRLTSEQWGDRYVDWLRRGARFAASRSEATNHLVEAMGWDLADLTAEAVQSKAKRDRKVRRAAAKVLHCAQGDLTFSDTQLAALNAAIESKGKA